MPITMREIFGWTVIALLGLAFGRYIGLRWVQRNLNQFLDGK